MKKCNHCKTLQPLAGFHRNKKKPDGRCPECKGCESVRKKKYYQKNKDRIDAKNRKWSKEHQEQQRALGRKSYHKRKFKAKQYNDQWRKNNRNYPAKWARQKRQDDLIFRLKDNLRCRLYRALKRGYKAGSAVQDLGCSVEELKQYLEKQFYPRSTGEEMTWDNHSPDGWHIDHIIPLSAFDLTKRKEFLKACHFTNLQPLWAEENYAKGKNHECEN